MSLLNKWMIIVIASAQLMGLTSSETPLFDPSLSARDAALAKASFSDKNLNNLLKNPASMVNTNGIAIHANEFLGIDYSSIAIVNQAMGATYGLHYIGSSIHNISRSSIENNLIKEIEETVPYEYHALSIATAKEIQNLQFGIGIRLKTLVLDNANHQSIEGFLGGVATILDAFKVGVAIRNVNFQESPKSALILASPIVATSIQFSPTKKTTLFLATIENKNEISTRSTFHSSIEHYLNDYLPIRIGLDHNRYTFGTGILLNPLEIDIGWAQSRTANIEHQVTVGFTYTLEEKNNLY